MKKLILSLFACGCFTLAFSQKTVRVAYINLDSLVKNMVEFKKVNQITDSLRVKLQREAISITKEFEAKAQEYTKNEATYAESIKQVKASELEQSRVRYNNFLNDAESELQDNRASMIKLLVKKAKDGVGAIAKEKGYSCVLETSGGSVIYNESSDDIFSQVNKKLESMPVVNLDGFPKKREKKEK